MASGAVRALPEVEVSSETRLTIMVERDLRGHTTGTLRLTDDRGNPLPDELVTLRVTSSAGDDTQELQANTDSDGVAVIDLSVWPRAHVVAHFAGDLLLDPTESAPVTIPELGLTHHDSPKAQAGRSTMAVWPWLASLLALMFLKFARGFRARRLRREHATVGGVPAVIVEGSAASPGTMHGAVVDREFGSPIPTARVFEGIDGPQVTADHAGRFHLAWSGTAGRVLMVQAPEYLDEVFRLPRTGSQVALPVRSLRAELWRRMQGELANLELVQGTQTGRMAQRTAAEWAVQLTARGSHQAAIAVLEIERALCSHRVLDPATLERLLESLRRAVATPAAETHAQT